MAIEINPANKGKLHRRMGIAAGRKISIGDLMEEKGKARKTHDTALMREATFALNARRWHHK